MGQTEIVKQAIERLGREKPFISNKEICAALGLTKSVVSRHVQTIRAEWMQAEKDEGAGNNG